MEGAVRDETEELDENTESSQRKGSAKLESKVCGVCGDKALGNNFNAITCESCKAFFRRNALRTKEFVCPFNDACKVDPVTRRFCQKCRLRKCLEIGMKKEWIMTDEEKKVKKQKIEQNRLKRASSDLHEVSGAEATAPKVAARLESPEESSGSDLSTNSDDALPPKQLQPMMPHNNNSLPPPLDRVPPLVHVVQGLQEHRKGSTDWADHFSKDHSHYDVPPDQPTQMPILASLVRPGLPESPPEVFAASNSTHVTEMTSRPESPDSPSLVRRNWRSAGEETESPHPPQLLIAQSAQSALHQNYLETAISPRRDCLEKEELPPLPLNTMDSILSVAISAEFNAFDLMGGHSDHSQPEATLHSRELNKAEKAKLNELFFASEALNAPVDADGPIKIQTTDPSLINVINLTDIAIRRLIKMSKKICAFKNMCQEDQIALLKGGCTEMMILRSVVSYDPERDSWNIPHSNGFNVKLGVLKEARGNLYEQHQRFVRSFKAEWRSDDNVMIILCAITLFTPERPNVIHKDVVKLEQDSYYYLLKRYLESTRNGCEARSTYLQLIKKMAELHVLNSNHLRVFLEVNPREVEPLLIEIFDLKQ